MTAPTDWTPGKLFEISGYFWKTCTLHAGVKLEVFTVIDDQELSALEIAQKCGCNARGMDHLLKALTAMDLLAKKGELYANTESARRLLSKNSPQYTGHIIMHHHHLVMPWTNLDQAVKTGAPVKTRGPASEKERESFLMGMFNIAMGLAPQIARFINLSGRKRLLDLGGGPGTYAIHFCMENQELSATIFDLPTTRPFAESTVARFDMSGRVNFQPGDFSVDTLPTGFDAVWISHILHSEGPDECLDLLAKARESLNDGGLLMIHEFILNNEMDGPLFPALFSLNMLIGNPKGQAYSEHQLMEMLTRTGFREIKRLDFSGPNDSGVISALK